MINIPQINTEPKTLEEAIEVIKQAAAIIAELIKLAAGLQEQLNLNSKNSSLAPSRDLKKKASAKKKSGRKQGGQPGHKGAKRELVAPESVSQIIDCHPKTECEGGGQIKLDRVERRQVFEIPVMRYEVQEYRLPKGHCTCCGRRHSGVQPKGISRKGFGPRVQAMQSLLSGKYRLSKRQVQAYFKDIYQMPMSVGSVSNGEGTVSEALKEIHTEVKENVQKAKVVNVDETGLKQRNKNGWAWLACTPEPSFFLLSHSRGRKVAKELIGN